MGDHVVSAIAGDSRVTKAIEVDYCKTQIIAKLDKYFVLMQSLLHKRGML